MCGFIGYLSPNGQIQPSKLRGALETISHRGPDDEGINIFHVSGNELCLAHRRLSIIDLSANGHQPFFDNSNRFCMVYNGEVYNYRELREELKCKGHVFRTDTDTEVVLEAFKEWGESAWVRFIGMFSLVIYDSVLQELIFTRDAFGIKPFYFLLNEDSIFFGSEIQAIKKITPVPLSLNEDRVFSYLIWGNYDFSEETFFNEIKKVLPAHCIRYDIRKKKIISNSNWWWPSIKEDRNISFDEAVKKLRELFLTSLKMHLRSDVPLGIALSGGIDSSAVACSVRLIEPSAQIKTFSFIARDSPLSEENWVDLVNEKICAEDFKIIVNPLEIQPDLNDLILTLGEPFGSTSIYAQYKVFKLVKENGVKVVLDGQGADELLAGYQGYPKERFISLIQQGKHLNALIFLFRWSNFPGRSKKQALYIIFEYLLSKKIIQFLKIKKNNLIPIWLNKQFIHKKHLNISTPNSIDESDSKGRQLVNALRKDLLQEGLQALLRHGDRNSMRWNVESRVPFLTIPIAEFLLSLPEEYLISNEGETKMIFKSAMRGIVPDKILDRKDKIGFGTPESEWLRHIELSTMINLDAIASLPYINSDALKSTLENQNTGINNWKKPSWRIINFIKWYEIVFLK
jgi:asparagine synthase (glutamine-hydrolysing)